MFVAQRWPELASAYGHLHQPDRVDEQCRWHLKRAECVARLVVAEGLSPTAQLAEILRLRRTFQESAREKRARVRQANIENGTQVFPPPSKNQTRALALQIWLPHTPGEWSSDFQDLAKETRKALRSEKSILQYIPRRKRYLKTELDLERNKAAMRRYIQSVAEK